MHELAPLIYDLAIMLGLASLVMLLFQRIHQPVVLGYLVAGIIVGPYTSPFIHITDTTNVQVLSELGVIFLMFSLGLEFSFQKLTNVGFSALVTGWIEVILMTLIGYIIGLCLGWSYYDALFLGAALAISSTTIIIKAIDELGLKTKRFAELIFGVLIVEDLLAILLLVALSTLVATKNVLSLDMLNAIGKLILVVGGWFLVGYFLMPPLFRRVATYISQETLTIISVALCLALVCLAAHLNYSAALGAFIMGSILAETILIHRIENLIRPIRDIFAAVFFISVGMLINPAVIVAHWPIVLLLTMVTIFGKILTTSFAALITGQSINTSVRMGFGMAQVGEFSFIIAALGVSLNVTSNKLYPIIVAVSGVTAFTTPYLIRVSGTLSAFLENRLPLPIRLFLENYTMWLYRAQTSLQSNPHYKRALIRLVLNGIIVAIIFTLVRYFLYAKFLSHFELTWLVTLLCLFIAITLASPFVWGMLFAFRVVTMPNYASLYLNPLVYMVWLVTFAEVLILSIVYFKAWTTIFLFILLAILFFTFSYRLIEKSYHWFEEQLLGNVNTMEKNRLKYADISPWDTHLIEIDVGEKSAFAGKTLGDMQIRQRYGVNIVAIYHGTRMFLAPRGNEIIMPHDKLIVLGSDDYLDGFREQIETTVTNHEPQSLLNNFILKALLVRPCHPFIGQSIRDSQIREAVNGLVVGLERQNHRQLNPDPDLIIQEDDLLLIVGEKNRMMTVFSQW